MSHQHAHPTIPNRPMSRRNMIKALAASSVAVGLGAGIGSVAGANPGAIPGAAPSGGRNRLVPLSKLGIILYSVRDKVSSIGFRAVFEELAAIGYSEIEFAGYTQGNVGPITPQEIRQLLDDNGLRAVGGHVNLSPSNIDAQLDIAETLGMPFVGQGGQVTRDNTVAGWGQAADNWNIMGEKARARGIKIYSHNHAGEFGYLSDAPDTRLYDFFLENTNPDWVFLQMDVYWAHVGAHQYPGFRPIDYLKADPRRFPLLHLKDGKINPNSGNGYDIIEFGAGDIDFQEFLSATRDRGQRIGLWEQDNAANSAVPPHEPNSLGNAARSYEAIAALRG
ncbi:sugar phosphate isomerase/epimerase family protein [Georgenia sp. MJ170]|uniref:sugar phosphate isomerase/epimerase family protein n=1 Tax=Georgenia sunbinii TaxID=3117728 RepID=UPI002F26962D